MNGSTAGSLLEDRITSFFFSLEDFGRLLGMLTDGNISVVIEFRGSGNRVSLDFSSTPARIRTGGLDIRGTISLAGTPGDLHDMLLGKLSILDGVLERRLLLRGGMNHIMAFLPVLRLVPVLYDCYADQLVETPGRSRRILAGVIRNLTVFPSSLAGRILHGMDRKDRLTVLIAFSRGARRFSADPAIKAGRTQTGKNPSHLLAPPPPPPVRAFLLKFLSSAFYSTGYLLSLLKHRLKAPVSITNILRNVSNSIGRKGTAAGNEQSPS